MFQKLFLILHMLKKTSFRFYLYKKKLTDYFGYEILHDLFHRGSVLIDHESFLLDRHGNYPDHDDHGCHTTVLAHPRNRGIENFISDQRSLLVSQIKNEVKPG